MNEFSTKRRGFLKFGAAAPLLALPSLATLETSWAQGLGSGKHPETKKHSTNKSKKPFVSVAQNSKDTLDLAVGFEWSILAKKGDVINKNGDKFGDCNDFICQLPGGSDQQSFLWVNHEYIDLDAHYGAKLLPAKKTNEQLIEEQKLVGGSFLELTRTSSKLPWKVKTDSQLAFRVDGLTPIPLVGPVSGQTALGTFANCSGGLTPWGTILTCEENFDDYMGTDSPYGWDRIEKRNPEHYGYVVEVNPKTKQCRKLTSLGRFAHEGALVHTASDGHLVVYMGDDARFECLYKFVSLKKVSGNPDKDADLLLEGTLYVANFSTGEWITLDAKTSGGARVFVDTRTAAKNAGGTPLNRPEGIALNAKTGVVYVALTNNEKSGDFHGSLVAIEEKKGHSGTSFRHSTFATGGPQSGFSCPDNVTMGPGNHLWVGMDVSSTKLGKGAHEAFPKNGLFRLEAQTTDSGTALLARCLLLAPPGAEVTGPCFDPSGNSLFVSIQHPGEMSLKEDGSFSSHWPKGGKEIPLSSVVQVTKKEGSFS